MPLFESETLRGYQYHQQNQTKNYVTIIIEIKEILKNVIAPYLEKEKKPQKTAFPESQFDIYQTQSEMKRLFLINLVILCSRIGLQNLTICPLPVFSTQNLRQKKNHSSALNENTYLFHQHFSKTKLHIIIYF